MAGNPAATRMSNPKLKEKRARSWSRGEARKLLNRVENGGRHADNLAIIRSQNIPVKPGERASHAIRRWNREILFAALAEVEGDKK